MFKCVDPKCSQAQQEGIGVLSVCSWCWVEMYMFKCVDPKFSQAQRESIGVLEVCKFTWLVLGGDPAVCSRRVEQFTAL